MEVLGLSLNSLIFNIFLPFLLFYVLLYALLRKSEILGKSNTLNALTAMSLAALGVFSLYQLGLIQYAIWIAGFGVLAAFLALFVLGTAHYSYRKLEGYSTGEAFKTPEEKNFEKAKAQAEQYYAEFEKALESKDAKAIAKNMSLLDSQLEVLRGLAPKLKKDLDVELPWLKSYEAIKQQLKKGG